MAEAEFFERIARDLGIVRGGCEAPELWHCRIAYSTAVVHGLASLWENEETSEEEGVSLMHVAAAIGQTLTSFRKLFPRVEAAFASFESDSKDSLQEQIRKVLQNGGCFYHRARRAAPVVRASAFENGISFLRGLRPGKPCFMSGAGYYRKGTPSKKDRDVFSMFGLQALFSRNELKLFEESLNEERRNSLTDWEFLCLDPLRSRRGYWKNTPDRNVLSLMRRKEGNRAYSWYCFDGNTFHCCALPEYWNEHSRHVLLSASLLAQYGLPPFKVQHDKKLVFVKPGYLLPPAEDAFFRLYSWPDFNPDRKGNSDFASRIMTGDVYPAFRDVMIRLGYGFEEETVYV